MMRNLLLGATRAAATAYTAVATEIHGAALLLTAGRDARVVHAAQACDRTMRIARRALGIARAAVQARDAARRDLADARAAIDELRAQRDQSEARAAALEVRIRRDTEEAERAERSYELERLMLGALRSAKW